MNGLRRAGEAAIAGDRPYAAALAAILAVAALMLVPPIQRLVDGRERLDLLERKKAALGAEIDTLELRVQDLEDPDQIELLAREELGLVKPGEVPYIVVTPEPERPKVAPATNADAPHVPWYRRLWRAAADLLPR